MNARALVDVMNVHISSQVTLCSIPLKNSPITRVPINSEAIVNVQFIGGRKTLLIAKLNNVNAQLLVGKHNRS